VSGLRTLTCAVYDVGLARAPNRSSRWADRVAEVTESIDRLCVRVGASIGTPLALGAHEDEELAMKRSSQ